ncbi:MAG: CoA transferase [Pigmentiphaga sp.]|nr:CoA transferase [Pigmentiphaga sp.]
MSALQGFSVLELGRVPPAELPGMFLADMGADVLKIDTPTRGQRPSDTDRFEAQSHTNRNKRSMAIDLKHPQGLAIFLRLAREADVIIEGFRPGTMRRLDADYESIASINPRIVYCSMSGFGQAGPYRSRPAHDLNFLALSGALSLWGDAGRAPDVPLNLVADYGGAGMHAALAIAFALLERERSGQGQHIDIAYLDTSIALLAATPNMRRYFSDGYEPTAGEGVFSGTYPYYTLYETRDRRWLSVACSEPALWHNFCNALDRPKWVEFERRAEHYTRSANAREAEVCDGVAKIIRTRDSAEWEQHFAKHDVCVAPVRKVSEMLADPHVRARSLIRDVEHPTHGPLRFVDSALGLARTPALINTPAPHTGEHTQEVLRTLGLNPSEIARLRDQAIID